MKKLAMRVQRMCKECEGTTWHAKYAEDGNITFQCEKCGETTEMTTMDAAEELRAEQAAEAAVTAAVQKVEVTLPPKTPVIKIGTLKAGETLTQEHIQEMLKDNQTYVWKDLNPLVTKIEEQAAARYYGENDPIQTGPVLSAALSDDGIKSDGAPRPMNLTETRARQARLATELAHLVAREAFAYADPRASAEEALQKHFEVARFHARRLVDNVLADVAVTDITPT